MNLNEHKIWMIWMSIKLSSLKLYKKRIKNLIKIKSYKDWSTKRTMIKLIKQLIMRKRNKFWFLPQLQLKDFKIIHTSLAYSLQNNRKNQRSKLSGLYIGRRKIFMVHVQRMHRYKPWQPRMIFMYREILSD